MQSKLTREKKLIEKFQLDFYHCIQQWRVHVKKKKKKKDFAQSGT